MRSALVLLGAVIGAVAFGLAVDPRWLAMADQRVIVDEFVARYCRPDPRLSDEFRMGEAAALSRVAIRSGLNPAANLAAAQCLLGVR